MSNSVEDANFGSYVSGASAETLRIRHKQIVLEMLSRGMDAEFCHKCEHKKASVAPETDRTSA